MSDLERFATWLVNNQDKKGTPDFETVAAAFKKLDTGVATAPVPTSPITPVTPAPTRELPDARERNLLRETLDVPTQVLKGAVTGTRFLTDTFGADNPISRALKGTEDVLDNLLSAQAKRDQREISRILKEAEDKGMGAQVAAGLNALATAPVDLIANAFGTAVPTLAAGLAGRVVGLGARAVGTGVGALTGVGVTKDAVYSAVLEELTNAGVSEEQAKEAAKEAQAYGGENLDNIMLGGVLGAVAARFGLEDTLLSRVGQKLATGVSKEGVEQAAKSGLIKEASRKALEEAIPEALQGGQEQFAQNIALQREGFDVPTFRGVTAGATLEGAVGAPVGALGEVAPEVIQRVRDRSAAPAAEKLLSELAAEAKKETEEQETTARVREASEAETQEFLGPLEEEAAAEEKARRALAKELRRDVDDPVVGEEFFRRQQAAREREIGLRPEFVVPESYTEITNIEAEEKAIRSAAGPEATLQEEEFIEDVLEGMRGRTLQRLAESILDDVTKNFIEGRRQGREDALAGKLGPEARQREQQRQQEREAQQRPEEVITLGDDLTGEELDKVNDFIDSLREIVEESPKKKETLVDKYLEKVTEAEKDDLLAVRPVVNKKFRDLAEKQQQSITEAYNQYQETIFRALEAGGYRRKDYGKFLDAEQKLLFEGDRTALQKTFPKISPTALEEIARARQAKDLAYAAVFEMRAGLPARRKAVEGEDKRTREQVIKDAAVTYGVSRGITSVDEGTDPSGLTQIRAEQEFLEESYDRVADRLANFTTADRNAIKEVQKARPPKIAKQASKYFKLPQVDKNPERAIFELAYDYASDPDTILELEKNTTGSLSLDQKVAATQPKTVVRDLLDNPPRPTTSFTGFTLGAIEEKEVREALGEVTAGVFRGEKQRKKAESKDVQSAVNWLLYSSNLSPRIKNNFLDLVKEFRDQYRQNIIRAVRSKQLETKLAERAERQKEIDAQRFEEDTKKTEARKDRQTEIRDQLSEELSAIAGKKVFVRLNDDRVLRVLDDELTLEDAIEESIALEEEELVIGEDPDLQKAIEELDALDTAREQSFKEQALEIVSKEMQEKYKDKPLSKYPSNRAKEFDRRVQEETKRLRDKDEGTFKNKTPEERAREVEEFLANKGRIEVYPPEKFSRGLTADAKMDRDWRPRKALPDTSVDTTIEAAARSGNLNRAIESIINKAPKEVRPLIRKMRSMAAGVTIRLESFDDPEDVGRYYYDEKVIALDPERGLNKETLLHELSHAALDRILADPNSKEVKQLFDFYSSIKTQMGDAHGGKDLYEFVAELVGNSEFQNLLKKIKAPKSKSLWETIVDSLLGFFGIRKGQNAYDASFKFLNDIITARPEIEPTSLEDVFYANENPDEALKEVLGTFPPFRPRRVKEAIEKSGLGDKTRETAFGALRLDNIYDMYGSVLKGIKQIIDNVEKRQAQQEQDIEKINKKYNAFNVLARKYKPAYEAMGKFAIEMRLARVDIFKAPPDPQSSKIISKKAKAAEEKRLKAYEEGKATFERLGKMQGGKSMQDMYRVMRGDFDNMYESYKDVVLSSISDEELRKKISKDFDDNPPIAGYIPARRYGEFILVYKDKDTGKKIVRAFESRTQRDTEITTLGLNQRFDIQGELDAANTDEEKEALRKKKRDADLNENEYFTIDSIKDLSQKTLPPEGFISDAMNAVKQSGAGQGLSEYQTDRLANSIYEAYIDLFPESSLAQSFRTSEDILGPSEDVVRVYGDTMVKWSRKLADIEYNGKIQEGFNKVRSEGANYVRKSASDPSEETIRAAASNIAAREAFTLNPAYGYWASLATSGSYALFMAGNISSAVVNLSSVPLLSFPILSGRFGGIKTANALAKAGRIAVNNWSTNPEYKVLYDKLNNHAQLRHTLEREVLEGARQTTIDYNTFTAKALSFLSAPISATERLNRATTGIMAYDLARSDGMSEEEAAEYALKIVKDVNTSGMATTAPKWMQSDIGRIAWTFKGFIWQSTYVTARAFVQATSGQTKEIKRQAFRQLVYMYGMSYAVGGMFGLPLFGAISTLVTMVANLYKYFDDDEDAPFNMRRELRSMGLSELILKGPMNEYLNIEISNRASIANGIGFREEPYEIEKFGYANAMALQLFGPMGSYVLDSLENIPLAFSEIAEGELGQGIERLSPSWLRNGIKTNRFLQEGARTRDGRPIDTDINAWNLYMQALGFTPADVTSLYETRALAKQYENQVMERRSELLQDRYLAITTGDAELRRRVDERIRNFRALYPRLITADTLERSYKSRRAAEREYISGIRYSSNFRRELDPLFRRLDNVTYYGGLT